HPQCSPDGKWIYFISDRNFDSRITRPWGPRQPEPFWEKQMKIYHVSLGKESVSPFHFNHELKKEEKEEKEKEPKTEVRVVVEEEGIIKRLREVPIQAGNYRNLIVTDKALFYQAIEPGMQVYSTQATPPVSGKAPVMMTPIDHKAEQKVFVDNVKNFTTSLNKKFMFLTSGNSHFVVELKPSPVGDLSQHKLDLNSW